MDPTANLREQLQLIATLRAQLADGTVFLGREDTASDIDRLCDLVSALNEWIVGGGFLPLQWQHAQAQARAAERRHNR